MSLARLHQPPAPTGAVYVFPHAGGSPQDYRVLAPSLGDVALRGVQYPGRGSRFAEGSVADVRALARQLADELVDHLAEDQTVTFLGHSYGALVAFETCRALLETPGAALPQQLWVSAFPAPDRIPARDPLHTLPPRELLRLLSERFDAIPAVVLEDPDLAEIVEEYVRADYRAIETYEFSAGPRLPLLLRTVGATDDEAPTQDDRTHWKQLASRAAEDLAFPGGHFFWQDPGNARRLSALLATSLHQTAHPDIAIPEGEPA